MTQVAETVSNELKEIEAKENHVNEMFRDQIEEYKDAKARLKSLEESKEMYTKRSEELTNTLSKLSADVASVKKKIDTKGSSITDTAPLVEIRSALQRLKAENKELDVRIGILVSCSMDKSFFILLLISIGQCHFSLVLLRIVPNYWSRKDYQLTNARKDSVARASITAQISCIHGDDSSIDDQ
jgi:hypothetical protein